LREDARPATGRRGKIASIADGGGVRNFTYDPTLQLTGGGYASARFRRLPPLVAGVM
jgi:hypothetical protein